MSAGARFGLGDKMSNQVYRNGKIHVCRKMCSTCIFRPGNLMQLSEGRVEDMVARSTKNNSCIPCHQTLDGKQSVCAGFFNKHKTPSLQLGERMGVVVFTEGSAKSSSLTTSAG